MVAWALPCLVVPFFAGSVCKRWEEGSLLWSGQFIIIAPICCQQFCIQHKHWHKIKSLSQMSLKIFHPTLGDISLLGKCFCRQGGWGGWKPLLQMDLELVRQQISSQAKRGKPTNNLIFFLLQKRWELSGWKYESNSVLNLACKLWQTSYILSLSNTFPYFILINWGILNLSGNSSDL